MRWFQPQRVFVVAGFVFGTLMALIVPPFQAPDEPHHFFRAYQISEGQWVPNWRDNIGQGDLPASLAQICKPFSAVRYNTETTSLSSILDALRIPLKPSVRENYVLATAHYSPIGYLPQAVGIGIGRARLAAAGSDVPRKIDQPVDMDRFGILGPAGHAEIGRPLLLLMLMPMSLFMAASVSADAMINALAFLLVALAIHAAANRADDQNSFVGWRWIGVFILCSSALALIKAAYAAVWIDIPHSGKTVRRAPEIRDHPGNPGRRNHVSVDSVVPDNARAGHRQLRRKSQCFGPIRQFQFLTWHPSRAAANSNSFGAARRAAQ